MTVVYVIVALVVVVLAGVGAVGSDPQAVRARRACSGWGASRTARAGPG